LETKSFGKMVRANF